MFSQLLRNHTTPHHTPHHTPANHTQIAHTHYTRSGQSIKVFSQLLRKARQRGFIIPVVKPKGNGPGGPGEGVGYEGATVLEPKIGELLGWGCFRGHVPPLRQPLPEGVLPLRFLALSPTHLQGADVTL